MRHYLVVQSGQGTVIRAGRNLRVRTGPQPLGRGRETGPIHPIDDPHGQAPTRPVEGGLRRLAGLRVEGDRLADDDRRLLLLRLPGRVMGPAYRRLDPSGELAGEVEWVLDDEVLLGEVDRPFEDR